MIIHKFMVKLKEKGRVLMEKNDITPEEFKENMDILTDILTIK